MVTNAHLPEQNDTGAPAVVRLAPFEKFLGMAAIATVTVVTWIISYRVNDAGTNFRLSAVEKQSSETAARVEQQERFGHPDHERRITKIEAHQDESDKAVATIDKKVDHAVTILERLDRQGAGK